MATTNATSTEFGYCLLTTYLNQAPSKKLFLVTIIKCSVTSIIAVVTVTNNFLFIRAYTKFPMLHCILNRLLVYLAASDFLVGALAVPLYIIRGIMELYAQHNCIFFNIERFLVVFLSPLSFFLLLLISYERFIAIVYPFKHPVLCTEERVTTWFLVTLLCCFAFVFFLIWNSFIYYAMVGSVVFLTVVQIVVIYYKIYQVASSQRKQIMDLQLGADRDFSTRDLEARGRKAEKTIACVLCFMLLCYAPALVFTVSSLIAGWSLSAVYANAPWFEILVFFNSSCNPFIYCWKDRRIRMCVVSLLPLPCRRGSTRRVSPL